MKMWRSIAVVGSLLVCLALITLEGRPEGAGQRGNAGGRGDAVTVGPGHLLTGAWGSDPLPVDPRGWGWMTKSYVKADYKRPFYNKAKEMLFNGQQVTSYTIGSFDPKLYCEVRKHYGFVWFEMQHSTMSWDEVAKMIAACPGPDGAAPFIRMPDQFESSIQKAVDLGAIGLVFPTINDGHQALEAAKYARYPPFGRRSSGGGQASRVWANVPGGYQNTYNDNMLVVVMLETLESILNADQIASTFGIDVVIQGNNDLARFSGWSQTDPRYNALLTVSRNATWKAGKFWGNAGAQYLTGHPLSADVRLIQNGPSIDGWTPPQRRQTDEEPTVGVPATRPPGNRSPGAEDNWMATPRR